MSSGTKTLYERLGGYTAIAAWPMISAQAQLGRFWRRRHHVRKAAPLRERGRSDVLSRQGHGALPTEACASATRRLSRACTYACCRRLAQGNDHDGLAGR
jgi:hypothetical protein